MSCSKLFSGDLPELTNEIIKNFQNDYSTLYSCVLVNRLWCRLAIPLLWENPFSIPTGNYNFIEVYLYNLNDCLKSKLNEYHITDHYLLPSSTLFNYPSFIRYLSMCKIASSIDRWLEANDIILKLNNRYSESIFEFKRLIELSLIELFIENEANLHTFEIKLDTYRNKYCDNILESILQNPNFINKIGNLKISILCYNTSTNDRISQIINSHQNLKKITLGCVGYDTLSFYQSLLLSKESNCSNTLNTIIFYYIDLKGISNLAKVFEKLNVLESLHIIYCSSLNSFAQQINSLTKPFKLKSLFIYENLKIDTLQSLLQKSGNYLENFGSGVTNYNQLSNQQLLELIIKYCRNIKFLDLYKIETHITSLVFSLIENIKQNLNYLSTSVGNCQDSNIELILQNLGQTLPSKLEYLILVLYYIKANDFGVFLKNSQDTFFKKLLINNMTREYNNDIYILPYIKEYIMKKKRVKYLAIKNTFTLGFNGNDIDLSNSKDEVKEFKSHNIKVQSYINLSTNIYNFVNEID
ncbi:hypothetical protein GLOIN_2v1773812 [Rhizophagus irregularis DAOM 181602=DAOM 197198]|uniref:F-box domain-containing protein n=1 Tax=Rhizophagus irregularis (strain DAOM 181602 / DAOM 197198 / MUCL 43194) TaxID=747089 RepID=A0A2P4Q3V1_RHIID|nr:hypothetical protein GLOIN_2v1773812 [Rhizophagus irregularis DAOM 181602=DAOM 197198]POG72294.1 hypothetical protein GLOIN_2v1773812 [Rhizophagus irregularis DAOM 181602=DAOM 197198]|eukprot:XP_025179160.1 hypothetical protein GLOIN_2v1773812 [Rhizophagus irregularis DAOM 181602=DAOM 197198]